MFTTIFFFSFTPRRLCILKGIYPHEPKHKKKVNKGSTAPRTFYLLKDIRFLLHEPIVAKFRDYKVITDTFCLPFSFLVKKLSVNVKPRWLLIALFVRNVLIFPNVVFVIQTNMTSLKQSSVAFFVCITGVKCNLRENQLPNLSSSFLKVFVRKLKKAYAKTEYSSVERLRENKPTYKLDHIIKERWMLTIKNDSHKRLRSSSAIYCSHPNNKFTSVYSFISPSTLSSTLFLFLVAGIPPSLMLSVTLTMPSACASSSQPLPGQENAMFRQFSFAGGSLWNGWTLWLHPGVLKRCFDLRWVR